MGIVTLLIALLQRLQDLVLADFVEGKGRFLDAAAKVLWSIYQESTGFLPAHAGAQRAWWDYLTSASTVLLGALFL